MRIASIILITVLFSLQAFAQTNSNKINEIRKTVSQINNDSGYSIRKLENEEFLEQMTDNGGVLTGYFKNGRLVKIIEWIGLSSCVNITEYYLQNNKLIFVFIKGSESPYIDSLETFDHSKLIKKMECRFYYDDNKMVKAILSGATRCGGQPKKDWAKDYFENYLRDKKLLEKK